jgi:tetratricopeptide (TPR) repeat protein/tRNA A-37 threonylcarbamoyl transferase component Bud32
MTADRTATANTATTTGGAGAARTVGDASIDGGGLELDDSVLPVVEREHYQLGVEHARGGLGRVLRARDQRLRRQVAIKELLRESEDTRARFVREAWITAHLQHPGIVPIYEAGRWPDGRPFYAMRLVAGQPLSAVIAAARNLGERMALLPKVLAVAETMAYAHSQRVMHRDLKPSNILVGDYGETVVIDWGLAKHLDEGAGGTEAPPDPSVDAGVTLAGQILGTPSYMSPEQARAEVSDVRADVYALGGILYHVLAGVAPYRGISGDVIRAVASGPPPALVSRCPDLAPDLLAIVDKAMARDLDQRYASAADLAADLRRFQTGQLVSAHRYTARSLLGRWVRRHRAAVIIAAVALAGLTAGGAFAVANVVAARDDAQRQEARAVRQRQAAEELVDYMLGEQKTSLAALGKLDLMEGVGQRVAGYYDQLQAEGLDLEGRERRALALASIGSVYRARGRTDEAVRFLQAALRERRALLATGRDLPDNLAAMITDLIELADVHHARGTGTPAVGDAATALALIGPLLALAPDHPESETLRFRAYIRIGDALSLSRRTPAALAVYRQGLAIAAALPAGGVDARDIYAAKSRIGHFELVSGDSAHAAILFREVADGFIQRARAAPDDMSLKSSLVGALVNGADAAKISGDWREALQWFGEARATAAELLAREPDNHEWQEQMYMVEERRAATAMSAGEWKLAQDAFQGGVDICDRMLVREPSRASWHFRWAKATAGTAATGMQLGQRALSWKRYRASLAAFQRAVALDPDNRSVRTELARMRTSMGMAHAHDGNPRAAVPELRAAEAVFAELASRGEETPMLRRSRGLLQTLLAEQLRKSGDIAAALETARQSLAIAEQAAQTDDTRDALESVAQARTEVARAMALQGDRAGALAAYRQLLDEYRSVRQQSDTTALERQFRTLEQERDALAARR